MPSVNVNLGSIAKLTLDTNSDLTKFLNGSIGSLDFNILSSLNDFLNKPLSELSSADTSISAKIGFNKSAKWDVGAVGINFSFAAGAEASLSIKKSGEIFHYLKNEEENEKVPVNVPEGFACVSIVFNVSLDVSGGATYSHGLFGVKANIGTTQTFKLANHKCFALTTSLKDALQQAFNKFQLPFKLDGLTTLDNHHYLEYEFIGKLKLGLGLSYGFSGAFLSGRSLAEINSSINTPLGSAIGSLNPSFAAAATLAIGYEHEDAFRIIVSRNSDNSKSINKLSLLIFRMDRNDIKVNFTAGITFNLGASFKIEERLDAIIDEAAKKIFANMPDGTAKDLAIKAFKEAIKRNENKRELEKFVKEANEKIGELLKKADNLKIGLEVLVERTRKETSLFMYDFDLLQTNASGMPVALEGFQKAMDGDFLAAMKLKGVSLLPGSYIESVYINRTTISFYIFDIFRVKNVTTYFQKTSFVYAGDGVFKFRFTSGVKHETGHVGHERLVEVFFSLDANTKDLQNLSNVDVKLNFVMIDTANRKSARQTQGVLEQISDNTELEKASSLLRNVLERDVSLKVKVSCAFHLSAYRKLTSNDFVSGKPPELPHTIDMRNWFVFVDSCNLILAGEGFQQEGFPDFAEKFSKWIVHNRATNGITESKPPDRRSMGNLNLWPSEPAWLIINQTNRNFLSVYFEAGRRFMNLCDDLKHLGQDLSDDKTDEKYEELIESLNFMIKQDIAVWFTKPVLLALFRLSGGKISNIKAPKESSEVKEVFKVSFDVV